MSDAAYDQFTVVVSHFHCSHLRTMNRTRYVAARGTDSIGVE